MKIQRLVRIEGLRVILISVISLGITFLLFSKLTNPDFSDTVIFTESLYNLSVAVISITFISSLGICFGLWKLYTSNNQYKKDLVSYISLPFKKNKKYILIMILIAILYGLIFAFLSQIFVYNSTQLLPETASKYPYIKIIPCCNTIGYVPMTYIYLTTHFFILLIPINMLLALIVSMLVGFNASLNIFTLRKLKEEKKSHLLGSVGATCGLFIGCPTCAGSIITTILGLSAGTASVSLLAPFQTLFILLSIPVLLITPFLIARSLRMNFAKSHKKM
jgi:hypothetical protein